MRAIVIRRTGAVTFAASLLASSPAGADDASACFDAAEHAQDAMVANNFSDARASLHTCTREVCPKVVQHDCTGWLAEVDRDQPSIVVVVTDADGRERTDARVFLGDVEIASKLDGSSLPINPGPRTLRIEAGGESADVDVLVLKGEKNRIVRVKLGGAGQPSVASKPEEGGGVAVGPIVLASIGGAALAAFGILEGVAQSEYSDLKEGCGQTQRCSEEDVSGTRTEFIGAGVAMTIGLAALGAAGVWGIVLATRSDEEEVRLDVGLGRASLEVRF
ncbi:MAG: hypothetical protein HOW73_12460 [Polyangiaceae bacterium]|nr:hypothetical protein [Polyangiaceae bacterium]